MGGAGERAWDAGCFAAACVSAWLCSIPRPRVAAGSARGRGRAPHGRPRARAQRVLDRVSRRPLPGRDRRLGRAVRAARRRPPRAPGLRVHAVRCGPASVGRRPPAGRGTHARGPRPRAARAPGDRRDDRRRTRPRVGDRRALDALEVRSPTSHSWMGEAAICPRPSCASPTRPGVRRALVGGIRPDSTTRSSPRARLGRHGPGPRPTGGSEPSRTSSPPPTRAPAGWSQGGAWWRGGRALGGRAGRAAALGRPPRRSSRRGCPAHRRRRRVRQSADLPAFSPGFYMARGDRGFSAERPRVLDRVYLDLRREGAVPFVREATRRLNRAGLAFIAKVVDEPGGFDRRDAAVLFFERRDRERALEAADDLARALAPFLDPGAPAMTLPLGPGLAFAEDPGGGESFGPSLPPHRRGRGGGRRARAQSARGPARPRPRALRRGGHTSRRPLPRLAGRARPDRVRTCSRRSRA